MEIFDNLSVRKNVLVHMTICLLISLMIVTRVGGKLLGDHICEIKIMVPQEVLKWELKNRTMRSYKWCMNVPPRCSVYSNKLVNETRISIINVTKSIETCCEGFKEQNNICVSQCQNCHNGLCISGSCICQTGWDGPQCDSRIVRATSNIPFVEITTPPLPTISEGKSSLSRLPKKEMPFSSTMSNIHKSVTSIHGLYEVASVSSTVFTDSTTARAVGFTGIPSTTKHPIFEEVLTIYKQYVSEHPDVLNGGDLRLTEDVEGSGLTYRPRTEEVFEQHSSEASYFDTTVTSSSFLTEDSKGDSESAENALSHGDSDYRELDRSVSEYSLLNSTSTRITKNQEDVDYRKLPTTLKSTEILAKSIVEEDHNEENAIFKNIDDFVGERYEKRSSIENFGDNTKLTITESTSKNLIYSICAAALTTFLILVVAVTWYAVRNTRKTMEKNKAKKNMVAVYTTSIFHSPLPDPPMFDNPTYLASGNVQGNGCNQGKMESIEVQDFNVVFQKQLKNLQLDCKQYLYDHPPSTGSYRASSEVDTLSQYNFSQRSCPGIIIEPLYDEIPSNDDRKQEENVSSESHHQLGNRPNIEHNCLYMNTCGRTKF